MDKEENLNTEEIIQEGKKDKPEKKKKKENKELEKLKQEIQEKDEKILRISAEMQNIRRRTEDEKSKLLKYEGENIITEILPILDNFEHAIKMDDANLSDELSKFLSGFKMIYGNMVDTLKKLDVSEIECLHEEFDADKMHAVLVDNVEEYDSNIVLDILQKGYMYKDKVIRPAMVKVNSKEDN